MIDFIGKKKIFYIISSSLILLGLLFAVIFGVKLDIQFSGGTMLTYSYTGNVEANGVKSAVESVLVGKPVNVNMKDDATLGTTFVVQLASKESISSDEQIAVTNKLEETFATNTIKLEQSNVVNPTIGHEFFSKCLVALAFAVVMLLVYVGFRFKNVGGWATGLSAIACLVHDVAMVFTAFVLFRIPIDANFMAVVLVILGYSINDTIVIFDRVRENRKYMPKETTDSAIVNVSLTQTLRRCITTSVSTIITMIVVTIVALAFNVTSIISFSIPMIIGLISGSYSSICLSGPFWMFFNKFFVKKKKAKR